MFGQDLLDLQPLWRAYARYAFGEVPLTSALNGLLNEICQEQTAMPQYAGAWRSGDARRSHEDVIPLLAADLCGGDIVVVESEAGSRFYNRLPYMESYVNFNAPPGFDGGKVIPRLEYIRHWDEFRWGDEPGQCGTRICERYVTFRDRAHFTMARAIR